MTTLETLFSPMQKEKLRQAALVRTSCRSFAGAPDTAAFAALSYVVGRCALPGARLVLTPVDESLFTGTILGMGRITGCKMAAVVIACGTEALCRVNAGILGEAFVLEATALGLGTCWVSGTYRRKQIRLPMQENETVLAVIAVGVPEKPLQAPENRRRKPLDKLMNAVPADGMMLDAAKLVQIAPSAMNMQPWRMEALPGAFALTISDRALLDGGIALCHAELALRGVHRWVYSAAHGGITAVAQGKFVPRRNPSVCVFWLDFFIEIDCFHAGEIASAEAKPLRDTRKKYGEVTNPIARKGQGRNSLAESRGRASGEVVIMENWLLNLIWVYLLAVNTLAFSLMGIDKRRAKRGAWRIAERTLFLPVVLFGSLGGTLGMFCFHHKTRHWYFRYGFPILLVVQLLLLGAGAYLLLR